MNVSFQLESKLEPYFAPMLEQWNRQVEQVLLRYASGIDSIAIEIEQVHDACSPDKPFQCVLKTSTLHGEPIDIRIQDRKVQTALMFALQRCRRTLARRLDLQRIQAGAYAKSDAPHM